MKLSLIYEAGEMSRRGFLKLLGKGAAASMAPPETALKGIANIASSLGSPVPFSTWWGAADFNADKSFQLALTAYNALKRLGIENLYVNDHTDFINGNIDPMLFKRLLPKLKEDDVHEGVYDLQLDGGHFIRFFSSKSPWYKEMLSKNGVGGERGTHPLNSKAELVRRVLDGLNNWAQHGRDITYSDSLRKWILDKGWEISPTKKFTFEEFPDYIQDSIRQRIKENPEYLKELNPELMPPEYRPKKPSDAHLEREVGYERQGPFDPRSSRPAQALGPFESRLKDALKILL